MRRLRLSTLLVMVNVALLLLVVAGLAFTAVHLLRQLADQQALARVGQAGSITLHEVQRTGEELLTTTEVLAQRPTLNQLVQAGNATEFAAYLEQYRRSSDLDACIVVRNHQMFVSTGVPLPAALLQSVGQTGSAELLARQANGPMVLGAWSALASTPNTAVIAARLLDRAFASQLRAVIGLPVTIVDRQAALVSVRGPQAGLRARVLATSQGASVRLTDPPVYASVQPIQAPGGTVVGLIEVDLADNAIADSVGGLVGALLLLALAVAGLAAVVSVFVGRRLGAPLFALTSAAARMGAGDLATPVQPARSGVVGAEIGLLAIGLEEMRKHLLRLTSDLRKQRAEAQAIVSSMVEGVFAVDRERRIQYLNPQAARLLGVVPDKAIGRFCGDVLHPRAKDGTRPCERDCPIIHSRFQGGVRATEHLQLADGTRRTVVVTSSELADGHQVQVVRDETELETTRRLRDAVLANISHEFKTPLAAQQASIELLLDQLPDLSRAEIGQLVLALRRGTARLTHLIDNLLESVRLEAGQDSIRRQRVQLDEVIEEAVELTRPLLELRDQHISVDLPYPLPSVRGDAARLTQVFVNLLANANKYAPPQTTIRVGGRVLQQRVVVWVQDTGPGLPEGAGETVFERFARGAQDDLEQSGLGLGLWIVKSIVERHGGHVSGESRKGAHGGVAGTRMSVTLPVEEDDEAAAG